MNPYEHCADNEAMLLLQLQQGNNNCEHEDGSRYTIGSSFLGHSTTARNEVPCQSHQESNVANISHPRAVVHHGGAGVNINAVSQPNINHDQTPVFHNIRMPDSLSTQNHQGQSQVYSASRHVFNSSPDYSVLNSSDRSSGWPSNPSIPQMQGNNLKKKGHPSTLTAHDDLLIVREVAAQKAHLAKHGQVKEKWSSISMNCNQIDRLSRTVSEKLVRERFDRLLKAWNAKEAQSLRSGEGGQLPSELDELLEVISTELKHAKEEKNKTIEESREREEAKELTGETILSIAGSRTPICKRKEMEMKCAEAFRDARKRKQQNDDKSLPTFDLTDASEVIDVTGNREINRGTEGQPLYIGKSSETESVRAALS